MDSDLAPPESRPPLARTRVGADDRPSDAVVAAVAAVTDRDPLSLPPLADAIDPDALDGLFATATGPGGRVAFAFAGFDVVVTGDGGVGVYESGRAEP